MDKSRPMFRVPVVAALMLATQVGTASAEEPRDFIAEAKVFYRVVSCGGTDQPPPANLDATVIEKHCAEMAKRYENIKKRYFEPASAFFAKLRPADAPTTVVY